MNVGQLIKVLEGMDKEKELKFLVDQPYCGFMVREDVDVKHIRDGQGKVFIHFQRQGR